MPLVATPAVFKVKLTRVVPLPHPPPPLTSATCQAPDKSALVTAPVALARLATKAMPVRHSKTGTTTCKRAILRRFIEFSSSECHGRGGRSFSNATEIRGSYHPEKTVTIERYGQGTPATTPSSG